MIRSIEVVNFLGEILTIDLFDDSPEHGLIVTNITGLGPAKANINTTDVANSDGSVFNSARLNERNIVIDITFLPANTIEDTRQRTYKYFPVKRPITFRVVTDNRRLEIDGYVESNKPDIFSKEEGNQISIICPDPYFKSRSKVVTSFTGLESLFEFPFSNEIDPDNYDPEDHGFIEFSTVNNEIQKTILYEGDAETGIVIKIHAVSNVENITIYNTGTRERIRIDTSVVQSLTGSLHPSLSPGDDVIISTVRKDRYARLIRGGESYNILNALTEHSWFMLTKGKNTFAYTADAGSENLEFSIENSILYEGI